VNDVIGWLLCITALLAAVIGGWAIRRWLVRQRLTANGWAGWEATLADNSAMRALQVRCGLAAERLVDRFPGTTRERLAALRLLAALDPTGTRFSVGVHGAAFAQAERDLIEYVVDNYADRLGDVLDYLRGRLRRQAREQPVWTSALQISMARQELSIQVDWARQTLEAWDRMPTDTQLFAIAQVSATGDIPTALFARVTVTFSTRLAEGQQPGDSDWLPSFVGCCENRLRQDFESLSSTTLDALKQIVAHPTVREEPRAVVTRRLLAFQAAQEVSEADQLASNVPHRDLAALLAELAGGAEEEPAIQRAHVILQAVAGLDGEDVDEEVVLRGVARWPDLRMPARLALENTSFDRHLRCQALSCLWNHDPTDACVAALAGLELESEIPLEVLLHPTMLEEALRRGRGGVWLEQLAARIGQIAHPAAALRGLRSFVTMGFPAELAARWLDRCQRISQLPRCEASFPLLAETLIAADGWVTAHDDQLDAFALSLYDRGVREPAFVRWLATRLTAGREELPRALVDQSLASLFQDAHLLGVPAGSQGLVRLPENERGFLDAIHLATAWRHGCVADRQRALQQFRELPPADVRIPLTEDEQTLALAVWDASPDDLPVNQARRLACTLWRNDADSDCHRGDTLATLLHRLAEYPAVLTSFLRESPLAESVPELRMFCLTTLTLQQQASLSESGQVIAAMEDGRVERDLYPFLARAAHPNLSAEDRIQDARIALGWFGEEAVLAAPEIVNGLGKTAADLAGTHASPHPAFLGDERFVNLLLQTSSPTDAVRLITLSRCWSSQTREILRAAVDDGTLRGEALEFYLRRLWEMGDVEAALEGLRRVAAAATPPRFIADLLAEMSQAERVDLEDLDWIDFELLVSWTPFHPVFRSALISRLLAGADDELPAHCRVAVELVARGHELPVETLSRVLDASQQAELSGNDVTVLVRRLLHQSDSWDGAAVEALIQAVRRQVIDDQLLLCDALCTLQDLDRLHADGWGLLLSLTHRLNQTGRLPGNALTLAQTALVEADWPEGLAEAILWFARQRKTGRGLSSSFIDRIRIESRRLGLAMPQWAAIAPEPCSPLDELKRRFQNSRDLSCGELILLMESVLDSDPDDGLPEFVGAFFQTAAPLPDEEWATRSTLDTLIRIARSGRLPDDMGSRLVGSLARSGRVAHLTQLLGNADDRFDRLLDWTDVQVARTVFRCWLDSPNSSSLAQDWLVALLERFPDDNWLPEILACCENLSGRGAYLSRDVGFLYHSLIAQLLTHADQGDVLREGVELLLAWPIGDVVKEPDELLTQETAVLLHAMNCGQLPSGEAVQYRLLTRASHLEQSPRAIQAMNDARLIRLHLRDVLESRDWIRENDYHLLCRHGESADVHRLTALLQPTPSPSARFSDLSTDEDVVGAAVRALPDDDSAEWGAAELRLAELLLIDLLVAGVDMDDPMGVREQVLRKRARNLSDLVRRLMTAIDSRASDVFAPVFELLMRMLEYHADHPQTNDWFEELHRRLIGAYQQRQQPETRSQAALSTEICLRADFLTAGQRRRLLTDIALQFGGCSLATIWNAAQAVDTLEDQHAEELMLWCARDRHGGEHAFSVLTGLVRVAGLDVLGCEGPGFTITVEEGTGYSESQALEALNRFLAIRDDCRAQLWALELLCRLVQPVPAAVKACELSSRIRKAAGDGAPEVCAPDWNPAFDTRYRQLVRKLWEEGVEGDRNRSSTRSVTERLTLAACDWLDLDQNPPADVDREIVDRLHRILPVFDIRSGRQEEQLAQVLESNPDLALLINRRFAISDTAIKLLLRWVPDHYTDDAPQVTLDDWCLLATQLAYSRDSTLEAQQKFKAVVNEEFRQNKPLSSRFLRISDCAFDILKAAAEHSIGEAQEWMETLDTATNSFLTPTLDGAPSECRQVYGRLIAWCGLAHAVAGFARKDAGRKSKARFLLKPIAGHPVARSCYEPVLDRVLATIGAKEAGDAFDSLQEFDDLKPLVRWLDADDGKQPSRDKGKMLFGRYEHIEYLNRARDSFRGHVHKAMDHQENEVVVVKHLPPGKLEELSPQERERVQQEVDFLDRNQHPGVVKLKQPPQMEGGDYYFVVEMIEGRSLADWVRQDITVLIQERLDVFQDLLQAVAWLHGRQVDGRESPCIHRQLHPGNVFVVNPERGSRAVITDMSSIKPFDAQPGAQTTLLRDAWEYIAPELKNRPPARATPAADVFSLGKILAFLLTRKHTPKGNDWERLGDFASFQTVYRRATQNDPETRIGGGLPGDEAVRALTKAIQVVWDQCGYRPVAAARKSSSSELDQVVRNMVVWRKRPYGKVYRAELQTGGEVAVKAIDRNSDLAIREVKPRLKRIPSLREKLVSMTGVVPIPRDPIETESTIYLFSEFVAPGVSLAEIYATHASVPPSVVVQWLRQCLAALELCHCQDAFHRMIKPSNILIDEEGHAYLNDFTLGYLLDDEGRARTGKVTLGDYYEAPERQFGLDGNDQTADLYSLTLSLSVGLNLPRSRPGQLFGREVGDLEEEETRESEKEAPRTWLKRVKTLLRSNANSTQIDDLSRLLERQLERYPRDRASATVADFRRLLEEAVDRRKLSGSPNDAARLVRQAWQQHSVHQ